VGDSEPYLLVGWLADGVLCGAVPVKWWELEEDVLCGVVPVKGGELEEDVAVGTEDDVVAVEGYKGVSIVCQIGTRVSLVVLCRTNGSLRENVILTMLLDGIVDDVDAVDVVDVLEVVLVPDIVAVELELVDVALVVGVEDVEELVEVGGGVTTTRQAS
jgi:hypothetical protein